MEKTLPLLFYVSDDSDDVSNNCATKQKSFYSFFFYEGARKLYAILAAIMCAERGAARMAYAQYRGTPRVVRGIILPAPSVFDFGLWES